MARYSGGCLCGALRWEANAESTVSGHCYCRDCRKASGSGFVPFMGFAASALAFSGRTLQHRSPAASGRIAVRNSCAVCGGLVFGGEIGESGSFTIYAGSLDRPDEFHPSVAIFTRDRPVWAAIPPGLRQFEGMPT
jgi:hypothetical protein